MGSDQPRPSVANGHPEQGASLSDCQLRASLKRPLPLEPNPRGFCGLEVAMVGRPWPGCYWCEAESGEQCAKR